MRPTRNDQPFDVRLSLVVPPPARYLADRGMSRRARIILGAALAIVLAAVGPAAMAQPYAPYDGHSPFNCQLQDVGTGTDFPHPDADPFCVEFDKTQQNVTDFGIFDFLSKEPARVAAAAPKCFYFQRDHWTGSIVQGTAPELWHWDGSYFFDKAAASGGANLANFRLGGQPMDGRPYAPADFQPYLSQGGGGGAYVTGSTQGDPSCAAKVDTPAKRAQVYYHTMPAGPIGRRTIGPFTLREPRVALHEVNGPAHETLAGTERFDVTGGGQLRIAYGSGPLGDRGRPPAAGQEVVAAILTTSRQDYIGSVHPGVAGKDAREALDASFALRLGDLLVFEAAPRRGRRLLLGVRAGSLEWLALADRRQVRSRRKLRQTLAGLDRAGKGRVDSAGIAW